MVRRLEVILWLALALAGCPQTGGNACDSDSDCPAGRYCGPAGCTFDCAIDAECPQGQICTPRGRCEPGCSPTNAGIEACDGLDNDCDGDTDESFDELGQVCANGGCAAGLWVCSPDGTATVCDGPQPAADDSTCDGFDDDCDGLTDEDAGPRDCELQQGVCAGAVEVCTAGSWSGCDYGPDFTPGQDGICDGLDSDCDGLIDEDAIYDYSGEFGDAAMDGVDNNCNGLVDEPGGAMVRIDDSLAIDAFEVGVFETAACGGPQYGVDLDDYPAGMPADGPAMDARFACSLQGIMPSGYLSWYRAGAACAAQGKRLCSVDEYRRACAGPDMFPFPYGTRFTSGACNDAWAQPSQPAAAGSFPACVSGYGAWDMSGNFAEWLADASTRDPAAAAMAVAWWECVMCHFGQDCWQCGDHEEDEDHFSQASDCLSRPTTMLETGMRGLAPAHFGARCCWDIP